MNLKLNKPLAFFDLETTGVNTAKDRIVEISILKILPDGTKETYTKRVNPEMPIPKESSEIHGIYDKDILDAPTFKQIAPELLVFLKNCDLAGYNSNKFDIPVLVEEFLRVEVDFDFESRKFIDVQNIFHKMEQRTLVAAYKFYCDKSLENAHSAEADIKATYEVLEAQLKKYNDLEPSVDYLEKFSKMHDSADLMGRIVFNKDGKEVFNFGKHKGKTVAEVLKKDPSYYSWMMNGDFPLYTKKVLTAIRLREFGK